MPKWVCAFLQWSINMQSRLWWTCFTIASLVTDTSCELYANYLLFAHTQRRKNWLGIFLFVCVCVAHSRRYSWTKSGSIFLVPACSVYMRKKGGDGKTTEKMLQLRSYIHIPGVLYWGYGCKNHHINIYFDWLYCVPYPIIHSKYCILFTLNSAFTSTVSASTATWLIDF